MDLVLSTFASPRIPTLAHSSRPSINPLGPPPLSDTQQSFKLFLSPHSSLGFATSSISTLNVSPTFRGHHGRARRTVLLYALDNTYSSEVSALAAMKFEVN
ncbi:hypothetical protein AMTR_s00068p00143680 [Amborella trichopoda]|uniref:Uncharacterized protein n=1 Tax=Amborella trichopoda TaxID=13333 RepID=U5D4D0_AMBTC|nr:hypothetical protein AMTR_s00068p00143680 [Amborella trichopoda]